MRSVYNNAGLLQASFLRNASVQHLPLSSVRARGHHAAASIAALRQAVARLETVASGTKAQHLPLGVRGVEAHLPGPGLACGVLNEVAAGSHGDRPAAFGFLFALTAAALRSRPGPAVLVAARRALADFGKPCGHGLAQLGLDVGRLLIVETETDKDALWTIEDTLRSEARPAMVAGAIAGNLDLTTSRRLNLAAAAHATPLVLLRTPIAAGTSAAATRWRIVAAPAARDRFGAFAGPRWRVALERCRNGRPGHWLIEWNHVAHCFRLVEGVADRAPVARAGLRRAG
jgi:protein ImuA